MQQLLLLLLLALAGGKRVGLAAAEGSARPAVADL
jgi:hypothetical protein